MRIKLKITNIIIIAMVIAGLIMPFIEASPAQATQTDWLAGWTYRAKIDVKGTTGASNADTVVGPTLYYASGINNAAAIFLDGHCLTDFSDVRITDSSGVIIPYILSNVVNSNSATLKFNAWYLSAYPNINTFYIYYGNAAPTVPDVPPLGYWSKGTYINHGEETIMYDTETGLYFVAELASNPSLYSATTPYGPYSFYCSLPVSADNGCVYHDPVSGNWYVFNGYPDINCAESAHLTYGWNTIGISNPMIAHGQGSWDMQRDNEVEVIYIKGIYYMFFMGENHLGGTEQVGIATSTSVTGPYTKYSNNPILTGGHGWDSGDDKAADPELYYDSVTGLLYVFVTACHTGKSSWDQGVYISSDMVNFYYWTGNPDLPRQGGLTEVVRGSIAKFGNTYYRLYSSNWLTTRSAIGTATGFPLDSVEDYKTLSPEPSISTVYSKERLGYPSCITQPASAITSTTATLNGYVTDDIGLLVQHQFEYGTTTSLGTSSGYTGSIYSGTSFTLGITGLSSDTTYYFRADVQSANGNTNYGNISSFHTAGGATIYSYYTDGADSAIDVGDDHTVFQTVTLADTITMSRINVQGYKIGTPGTITVGLYALDGNGLPTGSSLTSGSFDGNSSSADTNGQMKYVDVTPTDISAGTYAIVLSGSGTTNKKQFYTGNSDSAVGNDADTMYAVAQTFTTNGAYTLSSVNVKVYAKAVSSGVLTADLRATTGGVPTGSSLSTGTILRTSITTDTNGAWYNIPMTSYSMAAGTTYALCLSSTYGGTLSYFKWRTDSTSPSYSGGKYALWNKSSWSGSTLYDSEFEIVSTDSDNGWYWKCDSSTPTYTGGNAGCKTDATYYWSDASRDFIFQIGGTISSAIGQTYYTGNDATKIVWGSNYEAQTFTTTGTVLLKSVRVKLYRDADPGTVTVGVYNTSAGLPTGAALTSGTITGNSITTNSSGGDYTATVTPYTLAASTTYAIVVSASSAIGPYTLTDNCSTTSYQETDLGTTSAANWRAQTFTASSTYSLTKASINMSKVGSPGSFTLEIRATSGSAPSGSALATCTISAASITSQAWYNFIFSTPYTVQSGTKYALVMYTDSGSGSNYYHLWGYNSSVYSGGDVLGSTNSGSSWGSEWTSLDTGFYCYAGSNELYWLSDSSSPTYTGGSRIYSSNSGGAWTADATADNLFSIYTSSALTSPTCTTDSSTPGYTTATINGTVTADGGGACQYRVEYGVVGPPPFDYITTLTGSKTTGQSFTVSLTGLTSNTLYYYRVAVDNGYDTGFGSTLSFTTSTIAIVVTTNGVSNVTTSGATLNGTVTDDGGSSNSVRFSYGLSTAYGVTTTWQTGKTTGATFTEILTNLSPGLYHYRAESRWTSNLAITSLGVDQTFAVSVISPSKPTSLSISARTNTSITLQWIRGLNSINTKVMYRTDTYPTSVNDGTALYFGNLSTCTLTSIVSGSTYYISVWGERDTVYSADYSTITVTTTAGGMTAPDILSIVDVKAYKDYATIGDRLFVITYKIIYSTDPSYDITDYFSIDIRDSGSIKAQTRPLMWGYRVASIYQNSASALEWGLPYSVKLSGLTSKFGDTAPSDSWVMTSGDWMGNNKNLLSSWILQTANNIGSYYGMSLTTYTSSGAKLSSDNVLLGSTYISGSQLFSTAISGLRIYVPSLFSISIISLDKPTEEAHSLSTITNSTIDARCGTGTEAMLDTLGTSMLGGISGKDIYFLIWVVAILVVAFLAFAVTSRFTIVGIAAIFVMVAASWMGAQQMYIILGISGAVMAFMVVFSYFRNS